MLFSCGKSNHRSDDDHESVLRDSTISESTACPWSDASLPLAPSGILDLTASSYPTLGLDEAGPHGLLSVARTKQDMACYKQILKLVYAGEKHFQSINFTQRIDDAIQNVAAPMSVDAMLSALFKVHEEQIEAGEQEHGGRSSAFNKPIVILYDKQYASACESVIDRLKSLSNVTLVGAPSYGAMHISQAGRLWLPNSHILVKAGFERWIYPTAIDAPEGFGHEPDFYIIETDPVKVLDLAKKKLSELAN